MKTIHKIIALFSAVGLLIVLTAMLSLYLARQSDNAAALQKHAFLVSNMSDELLSSMKDAETAQRGYLLSGDEAYLEPYLAVRDNIAPRLAELRRLTQDDPVQQHSLDILAPLIDAKLAVLKQTIELRRDQYTEGALKILRSGQGKQLMDAIRAEMGHFTKREDSLMEQRDTQFRTSLRQLLMVVTAATGFGVTAVFIFIYLAYRDTRRRMSIQEQVNQELEQRVQERTTALALERDKLAAIFDNTPTGLVLTNAQGGDISMNAAALRFHGFDSVEDMHRLVKEYADDWELRYADGRIMPYDEWPLVRAIRGDYVSDHEIYYRNLKSGYQWICSLTSMPVRNSAGEIMLIVMTLVDITEKKRITDELQKSLNTANESRQSILGMIEDQKRAEEMLRHLNAELENKVLARTTDLEQARHNAEAANQAKSAFLATMSHEIRTPLTGMLGMLELLSLTPTNREQSEMLKTVWDSSRSLLRIVNDILDWSKIEEGKLALAPQSTSIPQLLQEIVNTYSRAASARNLTLRQHADARLSAAHIVDALRLSQILNNFVSNAIKFTQQGDIELRTELLEQLDSGERIRFSVKDTGIGIARDAQQHLFQRYRQASDDTARMYGGTGLGLAICRRLADLLDGQIELASEPGQGSTFSLTLTLPVSAAPGETVQAQYHEVEQRNVGPLLDGSKDAPLVLAVDDHSTNRDLLARQIKLLGLRAETAENGQVALSMWRDGRFALVITDCHMPEMDGYALTRAIREIEAGKKLPRTPVIAWTANALAEEAEHCRAAGMDEMLVKPTNLAQLKKMLAKWLAIAETGDSQPAPPMQGAEDGQAAGPIDYAELNEAVPEHAEQIRVLHDFQAQIHADRARLIEALEQGDQVNTERTAHRMKGSSRMVGARELASASAAIEQAARDGNMDGARAAMTGLDEAIKRFETYFAEGSL